jgi:hypothetical protein
MNLNQINLEDESINTLQKYLEKHLGAKFQIVYREPDEEYGEQVVFTPMNEEWPCLHIYESGEFLFTVDATPIAFKGLHTEEEIRWSHGALCPCLKPLKELTKEIYQAALSITDNFFS